MTRVLLMMFSIAPLLTLVPTVSHAQSEPPPVLDPADIFTDAVEVVETLPILNADNAARMLWYFDPAENAWRGYGYPQELEDIEHASIVGRNDGTFIVGDLEDIFARDWWYQNLVLPENSWIFDPAGEQFTRPEAACGVIKDLSGEGQWIIYQNSENQLYYLCFTETSNLGEVLPETVQQKLCKFGDIFWQLPELSADRNWLIFNECNTLAIYASDLATGQTNYLGTIQDENLTTLRIDQWVDATTLTIRAGTFGPEFRNYVYLADLTQANSLELIANQYARKPEFYDNPSRYIWDANETLARESNNLGRQEIYEYILQTRERLVLVNTPCDYARADLSICSPSSGIPNATGLLAVLSGEAMGQYDLVTIFDLNDGEMIYQAVASHPPGFAWEDGNAFSYVGQDTDPSSDTIHFVDITTHGVTETTIERPVDFFYHTSSPDGKLWLAFNYNHGFSLYDPDEETIVPVLLEFDRERYGFRGWWLEDGTLLVRVTDISGYIEYGIWIVRVR